MKFKLKADYQPTGDQPEAIKKLVKIFKDQEKEAAVLLGVTGSGKSLAHDQLVLVYEKKKGRYLPDLIEIGDFEKKYSGENYYILSVNPQNYKPEIKKITSFIKHKAPKKMHRITTSCGRSVVVTGDHNFWTLNENGFTLKKTNNLSESDYIPIPLKIKVSRQDKKSVNLIERLTREETPKIFVSANEFINNLVSKYGRQQIKNDLSANYKDPSGKLCSIKKMEPGCKVRLDVFKDIAWKYKKDLISSESEEIYLGFQNDKYPANLELSPLWLRLFGYYIAEGNCQNNYLVISNYSEEVRKDLEKIFNSLKIPHFIRPSGDYQVNSRFLAILFKNLFGRKSSEKMLPDFWPKLSKKQLAIILRAYFEGDGWVESSRVVALTKSQTLSSQISYALLAFGIWARLRKVRKKASNSSMKTGVYWEVSICGQKFLKIFSDQIGFISQIKLTALSKELRKMPHSNVDIVPYTKNVLRKLRKKSGLWTTDFKKQGSVTHSAISMFESGKRNPKRETLKSMLKFFNCKQAEFEELKNRLNMFWTPIKSIKKMDYKGKFVYDFSVEDNETFFAGSGGLFVHNTFTAAHLIQDLQKPTLVISHNKTLGAQLYQEFKEYFPQNAVAYFVSYYDYYMPESYLPSSDTYIAKEVDINEEIDKLRLEATSQIFSRKDVIVVASVSCIYNIGSPEQYQKRIFQVSKGEKIDQEKLMYSLVSLYYQRTRLDFTRGTFRTRGESIEIYPPYSDEIFRITWQRDKIEKITTRSVFGESQKELEKLFLYPAKHYLTDPKTLKEAFGQIREDLKIRVKKLEKEGKQMEANRLRQRVTYDLEMIAQMGYVNGIENYSRYFDGRMPGEAPYTLLDYFWHEYQDDFLIMIDESHMTVPQIRGMYRGDSSRKQTLIDFGFRLPSCLDNRPLKFEEFEKRISQVLFTSATPETWEIERSKGKIMEQLIRPTGVVDPEIEVRSSDGQIQDLIKEIIKRKKKKERVLITTLTKKTAEELTNYLSETENTPTPIAVQYLHGDVDTLERTDILAELRRGDHDVIVGVNLLREGLDLPEVSLVAILDADKQGFLRSKTALIQTMGRTARNTAGLVIFYADQMSGAMKEAIKEAERRRQTQLKYNLEHKITPKTIQKPIRDRLVEKEEEREVEIEGLTPGEARKMIKKLRQEMREHAKILDFEKAAQVRDKIEEIKKRFDLLET